jgi:hypothetical protein
MKSGIELISEERVRQIEKEGWTHEHDAEHSEGEIANAAACYAMTKASHEELWHHFESDVLSFMWPAGWTWKPSPNDRIHELVKAGALIAAEIDRLQSTNADRNFKNKIFS